jgi:hypothetical protein
LGFLTSIAGEGENFYYDLANKNIDIQIRPTNID